MSNFYTLTLNSAIDEIIFANGEDDKHIGEISAVKYFYTGKSMNTAMLLANLEIPVCMYVVCGKRDIDKYKSYKTERQDIKVLGVEGDTRVNQTIVLENGKEYKIINKGYSLDEAQIAPFRAELLSRLQKDDILLVAGSLPDGISPVWYLDLIKDAESKGVKVCFDAGKDVLNVGVKGAPFYIKPNEDEIIDLIGEYKREDLPNAVKGLSLKYGIENLVVSLGKHGVIAYNKQENICVRAYSVEKFPKDAMTTSCGDSFSAGFIYGYLTGQSFAESVCFGVACAGSVIFTGFCRNVTMDIAKKHLEFVKYEIL